MCKGKKKVGFVEIKVIFPLASVLRPEKSVVGDGEGVGCRKTGFMGDLISVACGKILWVSIKVLGITKSVACEEPSVILGAEGTRKGCCVWQYTCFG